jgi:hypothetical protein
MERCHWKETPLQVIVNGEEKTVVDISLTVNTILQAPYGLWRNTISIFLNTATNNFLEGTNFNYSCKPTNSPKCRKDYKMTDPVILNPLPEMFGCTTLILIPFIITTGGLPYCSAIKIKEDLETGGFGLQASSGSEEGVIKVLDDTNIIFYITLSKGSYRFFKKIIPINCLDQSNGIYTKCGQEEMVPIVAEAMSYDWGKDIEVVKAVSTGMAGITNPFENLFKNKLQTIIMW